MINLKKHLKIQQSKIFLLILFTAAFLTGCGKESNKKEYLARVNDSYLTRDELNAIIDSGSGRNFYKSEIIRDWINKELLYQEAKSSGVLDDKDFQELKNKSDKELAVTYLVNKIFNEEKIKIEPAEVKDYYERTGIILNCFTMLSSLMLFGLMTRIMQLNSEIMLLKKDGKMRMRNLIMTQV
jgi:hypothetical protein